jgi:hypothetical protein
MFLALAIVVLTPSGWADPATATQVEVLRGTETPFVAVSEVQPFERIKVCNDPKVISGESTKCSTLEDGKDNWLAKSAVFPAAEPPPPILNSVRFAWSAPTQNTDGSTLTDLAGYRVHVRLQPCDTSLPLCPVATFGEPIDIGTEPSFTCAGVVFECWITVQARNSAGEVGPVNNETRGALKKVPGPVTDVRQVE